MARLAENLKLARSEPTLTTVIVVTTKQKKHTYRAAKWAVNGAGDLLCLSFEDGSEIFWPLDSILYWRIA